jgi:hypothetical protein
VAKLSKTYVCGFSLAGIAGLNPTGGMDKQDRRTDKLQIENTEKNLPPRALMFLLCVAQEKQNNKPRQSRQKKK